MPGLSGEQRQQMQRVQRRVEVWIRAWEAYDDAEDANEEVALELATRALREQTCLLGDATSDSRKAPHVCPLCDKKCVSRKVLQNHLRRRNCFHMQDWWGAQRPVIYLAFVLIFAVIEGVAEQGHDAAELDWAVFIMDKVSPKVCLWLMAGFTCVCVVHDLHMAAQVLPVMLLTFTVTCHTYTVYAWIPLLLVGAQALLLGLTVDQCKLNVFTRCFHAIRQPFTQYLTRGIRLPQSAAQHRNPPPEPPAPAPLLEEAQEAASSAAEDKDDAETD